MAPIDEDENGFERVPLPSLDRGEDIQDRAGFQVNVKALRPPTAQELEDIRQVAYLEGYEEGKKAGFQSSRKEGYEVGEKEGRKAGQLQGLEESQSRVQENLKALSQVIFALTDQVQNMFQYNPGLDLRSMLDSSSQNLIKGIIQLLGALAFLTGTAIGRFLGAPFR